MHNGKNVCRDCLMKYIIMLFDVSMHTVTLSTNVLKHEKRRNAVLKYTVS